MNSGMWRLLYVEWCSKALVAKHGAGQAQE